MIVLEGVSKSYSSGSPAIKEINLKIDEGEFVFIVGNSGSGKSTLIKLLLKELEPTTGKIYVNGRFLNTIKRKKIAEHRRGIGVVFQDFRLLEDRTVYENVEFAMRVVGASRREIRRRVPVVLNMVGLNYKAKMLPRELSGGEQQRVALARALVNNPSILIADEPTGNLNPKTAMEIMEIFESINQMGTTIIMATHAKDIVDMMHKRVIEINDGHVVRDEVGGEYQHESE
jgi:cell division transport system ATP-binding protein